MTRDQAISQLKEEQQNTDIEAAHSSADNIICLLLSKLGYHDVVEEYDKIPKWYA